MALDAEALCAQALEALVPSPEVTAGDTSRSESMNALASLLLDWRADCERHLRGLTNLQRWLERVRCGAAIKGERELLLQEMARVLREAPPKNDEWVREAETHLNKLTTTL